MTNGTHGNNGFCYKKYSMGRINQARDGDSNTCSPWIYAIFDNNTRMVDILKPANSSTAHEWNTNDYLSLFFKQRINEFFDSFSGELFFCSGAMAEPFISTQK